MRLRIVTAAFCISSFICVAQDSTGVVISDTHEKRLTPAEISESPTVGELTAALSRHRAIDPFVVVLKVASKGDNAVPALKQLLFSTPSVEEPRPINLQADVVDSIEAPPASPDRLLAVVALETIGTPMAFAALFEAALDHPDERIRAHAINSLSTSYLYKSQKGNFIPDKGVLHLLLRNADDNTFSAYFGKSTGDIAREGLKEWAGIDLGTLTLGRGTATVETREQWWLQNHDKIDWSDELKRFVVRR